MSEKHYPYIGGAFDRIVFDGDGSVWVKERTCYIEFNDDSFWMLSCGHEVASYERPNFCHQCGARVVEDDKVK